MIEKALLHSLRPLIGSLMITSDFGDNERDQEKLRGRGHGREEGEGEGEA
jgi:hypothetical protein